jgi:endonuclease G
VFVPLTFWKVVVAPMSRGGIRAFGFITSQKQDIADEPPFEEFTPEGFIDEQATLAEIERKTIVRFSDSLKAVDAMRDQPDGRESMTIGDVDEIWLGRR